MYFCCVLVLWNENMLNGHSYAKQTITLTCNVIKVVMLKETNFTLCWMFLQVQSVAPLSTFGVKFHKCAQVHQQVCLNTERIIFSWTNFEHKTLKWYIFFLINRVVHRWSWTLILLSWHSSCWFTTWAQWVAPTCLRWLFGTPSLE